MTTRYPTDLAVDRLALICMQPGSHLEAQTREGFADRLRTADRSSGAVEGGEETVAGCVHFRSPVAGEEAPNGCVMLLEESAPAAVRGAVATGEPGQGEARRSEPSPLVQADRVDVAR